MGSSYNGKPVLITGSGTVYKGVTPEVNTPNRAQQYGMVVDGAVWYAFVLYGDTVVWYGITMGPQIWGVTWQGCDVAFSATWSYPTSHIDQYCT